MDEERVHPAVGRIEPDVRSRRAGLPAPRRRRSARRRSPSPPPPSPRIRAGSCPRLSRLLPISARWSWSHTTRLPRSSSRMRGYPIGVRGLAGAVAAVDDRERGGAPSRGPLERAAVERQQPGPGALGLGLVVDRAVGHGPAVVALVDLDLGRAAGGGGGFLERVLLGRGARVVVLGDRDQVARLGLRQQLDRDVGIVGVVRSGPARRRGTRPPP